MRCLGGLVPRRDLDGDGIVEQAGGEPPDVLRERGGEQQRLALRRDELDDPADVRQEAHVEHPVRLVEDEDLDLREVDGLLADVVEEPARRRGEDLYAGSKLLRLRIERDPAVDDRGPERDGPAVDPDELVALHRELARGHEDEDPDGMSRRREARVRVVSEAVEDRQEECRGLAGPGLGRREDVATREHLRNGRLLDRGGGLVALLGGQLDEIGREAE